jgi:sec-independent protein translocase protein TatA
MQIMVTSLLLILIITVLLMGPGKIAKLGGELGLALREFRRGLEGQESSIQPEKKEPEQASETEAHS